MSEQIIIQLMTLAGTAALFIGGIALRLNAFPKMVELQLQVKDPAGSIRVARRRDSRARGAVFVLIAGFIAVSMGLMLHVTE